MAAGSYSAGRVFLDVVPSYRGFMRTLQRDANGPLGKAIADTFEKQLGKAGYESGDRFGKELSKGIEKNLKTDALTNQLRNKLGKAMRDVGDDGVQFQRGLKSIQDDIDKTGKVTSKHVDELNRLSLAMHKAGAESDDLAKRQRLLGVAKSLSPEAIRGYTDEVKRADRETKNLNRTTRESSRDHDRASRSANEHGSALTRLRGDSQDGANAFRFFNFAVLAMAAVGVGLIPVLAGVAGGLALLGPILAGVGTGAGVAIFGLSGIKDAVAALSAQQDATSASSTAYQRSVTNAARAVADARRSLKDAYRSSAEGIANALERQRDAERNLADAQRDAKEAQADLTAARVEARQEQEDLANQIAQNQLDERQGVIDLFNAYNQYGSVMADGGSTNLEREQADIALKQAQLNLKRIREEQKRLTEEKKKSDKAGINGADGVRRAERRLADALERVRDANRGVVKATRDVAKARRDGARQIADAQRTLSRAQEDYNFALEGTAASQDAVNKAMAKLGPAGQRFAKFIFSLRGGMERLRNEVQNGFLPGLQTGMQQVIDHYGPGFTRFLRGMGKDLGDLSRLAGETFTNSTWSDFFEHFGRSARIFNRDAGEGFLDFLTGMASLMDVALPYAEDLSGAIRDMFGRFRGWATSEKGKNSFRGFLEYVERVGPDIRDFFIAVGRAAFSVGKALAPLGESVLSFLTDMFNGIANLPEGTLRQLGVAFLAITIALQASAGITAMISLIGALASAPLLVIAAAVVAIGAGFFLLGRSGRENRKTFQGLKKDLAPIGKFFQFLYKELKDHFLKLWEGDLLPAIQKVGKTLRNDLLPAFDRFLPVLKPIVSFLLDVVFAAIGATLELLSGIISGFIESLSGILDFLTGVFTGDWSLAWSGIKKIFSGAFHAIGATVKFFWRATKDTFRLGGEALKGALRAPLNWIGDKFGDMKDSVVKTMKGLWDSITAIMTKIKNALKNPIIGFLDLVINDGLIDGIRTLQGWVGVSKKNKLPHLGGFGGKYAEGGVLPGFTPGKDVHHFYSPTAGNLHLSGGEAIMRPEFTKAVGGEKGVARLNSLARKGMAFAKGGVIWPTKNKHWTTYKGHDGLDFNGPGNGLGDPFFATADGTVQYVGRGRGYGLKTELKTKNGPVVIYGHADRAYTHAGDKVRKGQVLGRIGYSGHVIPAGPAGSHLHFGLRGEPKDQGFAALRYLAGAVFKGFKFGGFGGDKLGGLGKAAISAIKNPEKFLGDRVSGGFKKLGMGGSGIVNDLLKGVPKKLLGAIVEKVKDFAMKGLDIGKSFFKYSPIGLGISGAKKLAGFFGGIGGRGPMLYDRGGYLPPGMSTVFNATGKPEPVFAPDQWDAIRNGSGGGNTTYDLKAYGADPKEVVTDFMRQMRFEQRAARRSGTLGRKVSP